MEIPISQFIEMFGDPFENPKGYVKKTIGDVCDFQGGSQPPRKEFVFKPQEGYVRLIQIRDYKTDDYITYAPEKMCRRFCDADDIMIGRYGPPIFQILQGIEGAYNVALMKAIPHGINKEFMRAYLKRDELLHHLELFSTRTAGQSGIEMSELRGYPCLVPPEEEQLQYVEFVKQSDKSKFACLKSQFIEMFGLPENNAHRFDVGVIGDVVKDVHYGTAKKAIDKGKYIYLRMNNITYDGELDLSDIKRIDVPDKDLPGCMVQRGDVLFNRTNSKDLVGKTCCFSDDEPMIIAGYIIRLRMNGKVLPEYLSVFMNLERSKKMLYSMAKGAVGQANINAKEVQSIEIVIPPMDIQNSFLTLSRQSDKSKLCFHLHTTTLHYAHS